MIYRNIRIKKRDCCTNNGEPIEFIIGLLVAHQSKTCSSLLHFIADRGSFFVTKDKG